MAPSRAAEGHGTCPRERRGLSCLGREARRERVSTRFGSTAGLTDACGAEAGEESGAGSGQPWKEPIKGSSSPRRASPCGSSVAQASSSFSKKKPTTQASVSNFLIQNCWSLIQKLENTVEVEHTGGWAGGVSRVPGKLLHARQDPRRRDHVCGKAFCDPPQSELDVLTALYCGTLSVSICVYLPSTRTCPIQLISSATSRHRGDAQ